MRVMLAIVVVMIFYLGHHMGFCTVESFPLPTPFYALLIVGISLKF